MFNKKKKEETKVMTEQDLNVEARKLYQAKIAKANKEINAVLQKYGLTLRVTQGIELIPKR